MRPAQQFDRALDLAPLGEMDDIADRAAAVRPLCRLNDGEIAEQRHQFLRLVNPGAVDVNMSNQSGASFLFGAL